MVIEILDYIAKWTYHVVDESGYPAKIPISTIVKNFKDTKPEDIHNILQQLKEAKWITSYIWNKPNLKNYLIRITAEGVHHTKEINDRRGKYVLVWLEETPYLLTFDEWLDLCKVEDDSEPNWVLYKERKIQHDHLKEIKLKLKIEDDSEW